MFTNRLSPQLIRCQQVTQYDDGAESDEGGVESESIFPSPAPTAEQPAKSIKLTNPKTSDLYITFSHSVIG